MNIWREATLDIFKPLSGLEIVTFDVIADIGDK